MKIEAVMLVATVLMNGQPNRVVPAPQPFFRSEKECRDFLLTVRPDNLPKSVVRLECEMRTIDTDTGRAE